MGRRHTGRDTAEPFCIHGLVARTGCAAAAGKPVLCCAGGEPTADLRYRATETTVRLESVQPLPQPTAGCLAMPISGTGMLARSGERTNHFSRIRHGTFSAPR